jgi:hypothetical protein
VTVSNGDDLWVWQSEDKPGYWSCIVAAGLMQGQLAPLMARSRGTAEHFAELAFAHGEGLNQRVRLAKFTITEIVEERDARG